MPVEENARLWFPFAATRKDSIDSIVMPPMMSLNIQDK
jgi:hypothetical protein